MTTASKPKTFGKLSKKQQRIAVVKDALLQAINGSTKIKANNGYLKIPDEYTCYDGIPYETVNSEAAAKELNRHCTVCAKGALFMASVMRLNGLTVNQTAGMMGSEMSTYMTDKRLFTNDQLDIMENAFESSSWDRDEHEFHKTYSNDTTRFAAICLNIIANNGTFVPSKRIPLNIVREKIKELSTVAKAANKLGGWPLSAIK